MTDARDKAKEFDAAVFLSHKIAPSLWEPPPPSTPLSVWQFYQQHSVMKMRVALYDLEKAGFVIAPMEPDDGMIEAAAFINFAEDQS